MKKKFLLLLCIIAILLTLSSCGGFNYTKEYEAIGTAIEKGNFSEASSKYLAFIEQQKKDLETLEIKMQSSVEQTGNISEKDQNRYTAIARYNLKHSYEDAIYRLGYSSTKGKARTEAAIWLYENTSWPGPYVTIKVGNYSFDKKAFNPADSKVDLSYLENKAKINNVTLDSIKVENKSYTPENLVIDVSDPFGFTATAIVNITYSFDTLNFADPIDDIVVKSNEKITLPTPLNSKEGYTFLGWALGHETDEIYNVINKSSLLQPRDSVTPNIEADNTTYYAMYENITVADYFIADMDEYSNINSRLDRGEKNIKLVAGLYNGGNTLTKVKNYKVGELSEEDAKYVTINQIGSLKDLQSTVDIYPDYLYAPYNNNTYNVINKPYSEVSYKNSYMRNFYNDSLYYLDISVSKDVPEGEIISIPFTTEGLYGNYNSTLDLTINTSDADIKVVDFTFSDSVNKDGQVNPGETIYLEAIFANTGTRDRSVNAQHVLSSKSPYVKILNAQTYSKFIIPGEFSNGQYCDYTTKEKAKSSARPNSNRNNIFSFTVSADTPDLTELPLVITTTDAQGKVHINNITLTAVFTDGRVVLSSFKTSEVDGDKDGTINPGETFLLDPCFKNSGTSNLVNAKLKLTTSTPGVTIASDKNSISWSSLKSGKYGNSTSYDMSKDSTNASKGAIKITVSKDYDLSKPITLNWTITADGNNKGWSGVINIPVTAIKSNFVYFGHKLFETEGNLDDVVSPGETFALDVAAKNAGTAKSAKLNVTFVSDSKYLSFIKPGPYTLSTVDSGKTITSYGYVNDTSETKYYKNKNTRLVVSKDFPVGQTEYFIARFDDGINTWDIKVPVTAKLPDTSLFVDDFVFIDTSNGNGKVEIGESAYLDIRIKNQGNATAKDVTVNLSVESGNIIITSGTFKYGEIKGDTYKSIYRSSNSYSKAQDARLSNNTNYSTDLAFRIPQDTEVGTLIKIKATFTDYYGQSWDKVFTFTAEQQKLGLKENISFYDKASYELLYPGEKPRMTISVTNTSPNALNDVKVTITSDSPYVTGLPHTLSFKNTINKGNSSKVTSSSDTISISSRAPLGEKIKFNLLFTDSNGTTYEATREYEVGPNSPNVAISNIRTTGLSPNGMDSIVPGGYVYLDAVLCNIGAVDGSNIIAKFSTESDLITINQPMLTYATFRKGSYYTFLGGAYYSKENDAKAALLTGSSGIEAKISENAKSGDMAEVLMEVYDGASKIGEQNFIIYIK